MQPRLFVHISFAKESHPSCKTTVSDKIGRSAEISFVVMEIALTTRIQVTGFRKVWTRISGGRSAFCEAQTNIRVVRNLFAIRLRSAWDVGTDRHQCGPGPDDKLQLQHGAIFSNVSQTSQ